MLYSLHPDMPNQSLDAINWVYFGLWRHVQQSMEGAQIHDKTKAGSKGNTQKCAILRTFHAYYQYFV